MVLKKKYRQMLQEKEAKHPRMDGEEQRHPSPAKTAAAAAVVQWDAGDGPTRCLQQDEPVTCAAEVKPANSYFLHQTPNKQSARAAAGATQRRRTTIALCVCVAHLFVNKASCVCTALCIQRRIRGGGVGGGLPVSACKLVLETQQVKGLTGLHKVGKAVKNQHIGAPPPPHLKRQCGFNAA